MTEEFAYKDNSERWIPGFPNRKAAIDAAIALGKTQVFTAHVSIESPAYFARFEARAILAHMISGLEEGEKIGKLVGGAPAVEFLMPILSAGPGDGFLEGIEPKEWNLQVEIKLPPAKPEVYCWGASKALVTRDPPKGGYSPNFI